MWRRTSNCSSLLIYRPRENERLSWLGWMTYSGRLTHISGHPSATGRAQDGKRTLARDWRSTAEPRGPTNCQLSACTFDTSNIKRLINQSTWQAWLCVVRASSMTVVVSSILWSTIRSLVWWLLTCVISRTDSILTSSYDDGLFIHTRWDSQWQNKTRTCQSRDTC